jgi:hypothetical protein
MNRVLNPWLLHFRAVSLFVAASICLSCRSFERMSSLPFAKLIRFGLAATSAFPDSRDR